MTEESKVWFVKHPTFQYKEDVIKLARKNDLQIIDARFDDGSGVKGPKLTLKTDKAKKSPKPVEAEPVEETTTE